MATEPEIIRSGTGEVSWTVVKYIGEDGRELYDAWSSVESIELDEWYDTAEEAEQAIRDRLCI